ncbi:MAG: TVP38/TMEM64 family protein, partial [Acetivibrio ethanolgignens]
IAGCVVLALPGVTFAIAAGLLFGPLLGTVCCSMATTIGAMMAFAAGRFFLKDSVKPVVIKNRYLKRWLFDESEKNEVFVLMLTRLVPLFPYNLQNFAYGITDIKFSTYSICSLIFMLPGTAMYTVGAAGLTDRENRLLYIGIAAFLAVIVTGLGVFLKKRYMQKEQITEDGRKG